MIYFVHDGMVAVGNKAQGRGGLEARLVEDRCTTPWNDNPESNISQIETLQNTTMRWKRGTAVKIIHLLPTPKRDSPNQSKKHIFDVKLDANSLFRGKDQSLSESKA